MLKIKDPLDDCKSSPGILLYFVVSYWRKGRGRSRRTNEEMMAIRRRRKLIMADIRPEDTQKPLNKIDRSVQTNIVIFRLKLSIDSLRNRNRTSNFGFLRSLFIVVKFSFAENICQFEYIRESGWGWGGSIRVKKTGFQASGFC